MLTHEATAHSTSIPEPLSGAYFWLLAFFVVYCARPEDWIPGLHELPLAKITGMLALVAFVLSLGQARRLPREVVYLFLLFAQLCLTVPFSPVWRGGAFNQVLDFSKVVVIVPVTIIVVSSLARLRRLIFIQTASVFAVAIVSLVKGQVRAGRLEGVLRGVYGNPNDIALGIVLTIPFCFVFMLVARSAFRKAFWLLAATAMTYCLFRTASRGGLLAFVAAMGLLLRELGIKGGRRYLLPLAGLIVLGGWLVAGQRLKERFDATVGNLDRPEDKSAYGSALQRREILWRSLVVTAQHPLFGVGPGNFTGMSGTWHDPHNSYTQISAEGGVPALVLYLIILRLALANVGRTRRLPDASKEEHLLAGALRASLAGYLVGSFFISFAYNFFPYFLAAYASALYAIAAKRTCQKRSGHSIAGAPLQPEGHREPKASAVTWADYQKGRAL